MTPRFHLPPDAGSLIGQGALVAVSHSGGKDSQAMTILLSAIVPAPQLAFFHAVIVSVERLGGGNWLILVEPGDSIAQIENELRVKSQP